MDDFTVEALAAPLRSAVRRSRACCSDQHIISRRIGNAYSDEVLHAAKDVPVQAGVELALGHQIATLLRGHR